MKKILFNIATFAIFSCGESSLQSQLQDSAQSKKELSTLEAKLKETKCRTEFSEQLLEFSSTTERVYRTLPKEYNEFQKMQTDSTVSCDSLKTIWRKLCDQMMRGLDLDREVDKHVKAFK